MLYVLSYINIKKLYSPTIILRTITLYYFLLSFCDKLSFLTHKFKILGRFSTFRVRTFLASSLIKSYS